MRKCINALITAACVLVALLGFHNGWSLWTSLALAFAVGLVGGVIEQWVSKEGA